MPKQLNQNIGSLSYDHLFSGGTAEIVPEAITLTSGRVYERGSVLGIVTATKKAVMVDSTQTDGSENPYIILADTVDATTEDCPAVGFLTGEFNPDALKFGGTDTAETHRIALRKIGIYLKTTSK